VTKTFSSLRAVRRPKGPRWSMFL